MSNGTLRWGVYYSGVGNVHTVPFDVVCATAENLVVAGTYPADVDFGGITKSGPPGQNPMIYVAQYVR